VVIPDHLKASKDYRIHQDTTTEDALSLSLPPI